MMARNFIPFLILFLSYSVKAQDQERIDQLQELLQTTIEDTIRIGYLNALAWELISTDLDTAFFYSEQALALSKKTGWERGLAGSYSKLGVFSKSRGDHALALEYYDKSLIFLRKLKDEKGVASSLGNIGVVYQLRGDYPKSLEYYLKAYKAMEQMGEKVKMATILGNIGIVYYRQEDYAKTLEYYEKALRIDEELGNKQGVSRHLGNIGIVHYEQKDYTKALDYYFEALKINEQIGNKADIASWLGNIGSVYTTLGNRSTNDSLIEEHYARGLDYHLRSLKLKEELGTKQLISSTLANIGGIYRKQKKYPEAERYLLKALKMANDLGAQYIVQSIELMVSMLYEQKGQYQKSYEHYIKYALVKDSLFNEEKSKDLGKLEAKYEFEKAEQEGNRLEEETRVAAAKVEQRRNNLQYSGILIFLVMLSAGLVGLGKLAIPLRLAEGLIFFTFLLFFEFTLVLLDPYIEVYSSGAPAIKLGFNAILAAMIFPLHSFFEEHVKKRIVH